MNYNEFNNLREKPQVRPVTTMDPKELDARIEKAKAKAFKKPDPIGISKLWAKEKPATEAGYSGVTPGGTKVDYANMMFRGKEIDHNSIDYEMQDYSDGMFELHGAKYIDGTELNDEELEAFEATDELQEWVRIDYVSEDAMTSADVDRVRNQNFTDQQIKQAFRVLNHPSVKGGNMTAAYNIINKIARGLADHPSVANALMKANEGFIGKKSEYNDFLQNKLDSAIQEYDSPEKKAERDALMQKYLKKGGKIEKVPTGKTAYKNKELKPAYRKDNGTPITSPGSDESVQEDTGSIGNYAREIATGKIVRIVDYTDDDEGIYTISYGDGKGETDVVAKDLKFIDPTVYQDLDEEAPFGDGMSLIRMALMRKFITAEEWFHLKDELKAAGEEVEQRYDDWPEGEGFGSSDGNFAIKELMGIAGYEFDEQDRGGRFIVTKMPEKLEKQGIKNVRMRDAVAKEDSYESKLADMLNQRLK